MKKLFLSIIAFVAVACTVSALEEIPVGELSAGEKALLEAAEGEHKVYRLWPGDGKRLDDPLKDAEEKAKISNILRIENVTVPSMMVMKPEKPDGRAVVLFPGGGYGILAAEHEGTQVGEWLNGQGITVFVVKYRCPRRKGLEKHVVALQDAQRAIRLVRSNAKKFGINVDKIGVMGFSAGGHLSTLTCHQFDKPSYAEVDDADKVQCKPNFAILVYPAYLVTGKDKPLDPMVSEIKDGKMPVFITIGVQDKNFVPGAHKYAEFLMKENQSVDYHLYAVGRHGSGLKGFPWVKACEIWLKDNIK